MATSFGHFHIVRFLVERGLDFNQPNNVTFLHASLYHLSFFFQFGTTPLGVAAMRGHTALISYLVDCGASIHVRTQVGLFQIRLAPLPSGQLLSHILCRREPLHFTMPHFTGTWTPSDNWQRCKLIFITPIMSIYITPRLRVPLIRFSCFS